MKHLTWSLLVPESSERVVTEFLKQKQTSSSGQHQTESKELKNLEKRLGDLEKLISKSYEELMLGDIPRETVLEMINKSKKEQSETEERANFLRENLTIAQETETDVR